MKNKTTKGSKAVLNTIYNLTQNTDFKASLEEIRQKYRLQPISQNDSPYTFADHVWGNIPLKLKPFKRLNRESAVRYATAIHDDLRLICQKYGLYLYDHVSLITPFLYFHDISRKDFFDLVKTVLVEEPNYDVCELGMTDTILQNADSMNFDDAEVAPYYIEDALYMKQSATDSYKYFPVALLISRSATITKIIDYVRKYKDEIKQFQKKGYEGELLIKDRSRTMHAKYHFIWLNRNVMPRKKLAEMVNKKFHTKHDEIYIRNQISKLKRGRNQ